MELGSGRPVWALGVMTGTSMDAVDVAAVLTDGHTVSDLGPALSVGIPAGAQTVMADAMDRIASEPTARLKERGAWPDWLIAAERTVREAIGNAARTFVEGADFDWAATVSGVHGQTVIHRPDEGFTLQIGMAPETGGYFHPDCTDVIDFRSADMEAGGQGAPLAPFYHHALARHIGASEPLAFLNIGGVANVTWVDPSKAAPEEPGALMAFDTGPGNALINDWMGRCTAGLLAMDVDGGAASTGRVRRDRLKSNSAEVYLRRRPPKSLDRNDFLPVLTAMEGLSINDGAATLTAFTADCVRAALRHMPSPPSRWLVCGGGRLNTTMMALLAERLRAPVDPVEAVGLDGDMLEAQCFAYLAVRALRGLPTSAPGTTGCRAPVCGGRIHVR